ncbi:MAG TPA: beta-glucosidase BglX [Fodinibius sp.]|nr:beta-glucosidase BglX [Fodinibius sp.]
MRKSISTLSLILLMLVFNGFTAPAVGQSWQESMDQKINSLLNKMTLTEKVGQMTLFTSSMATTGPTMREDYKKLIKQGKVGAVFNAYGAEYTRELQQLAVEESRLGIPLLFGYDVIHGFRTIFPIPLGETASWEPQLAKKSARVAAKEATAVGLHWTFAPMVDVTRDPRWGRIAEGTGEDPYLASRFAAARVRGFQGDSLYSTTTLLACAKHFAVYGAAEGGRDYNTVNMSRQRLWEVYLPPFKAALEAGVGTFMTAFNEFNGIPATGNQYLFNQILRQRWGFGGFVVTDYTSIPEMIAHGAAPNAKEAVAMAINANVDMDMQSGLYLSKLPELVKDGRVSEEQINQAVRRILEAKYKLGLFGNPYRYVNPERQEKVLMSDENRDIAREVARESIVLLKNEEVLPLSKEIESLAVIGPLADNKQELLGPWSAAGRWQNIVTVLQGIRQKVGSETNIHFTKGSSITGSSEEGFDKAVQVAENAEVAVVVLGEKALMSGEAASRATLDLPGVQLELLKAVEATGTPTVLVLMNGRPLAITWADKHVESILETWFLGTEAGHAIADILFGDDNPSGKLPVTFPRTVGQVPYYYYHKSTGRPMDPNQKYTSKYIDVKNSPLYPFGYGLSYTTFAYDNLQLSTQEISNSNTLHISVEVKNIGDRAGEEVVQLYIQDLYASITRPVKELRDFKKIRLVAGDTRTVSFTLTKEDLAFYNHDIEKIVEPGRFMVYVGTNSQDVLEAEFSYVDTSDS